MSEFSEQRVALNQTRSEHETARLNHFAVNERLKVLHQQKADLDRKKHPNNLAYQSKIEELESKISSLTRESDERQALLDSAKDQFDAVQLNFGELTDPRVQLPNHFRNKTPFLLLPTRLETRFKTITEPESGDRIDQLWVRVYPDTCMVDSFDPQLSAQEIRNGARFWAEYYAAGEIEDEANPDPKTLELQQAAWAFLVSTEGAGRGAWIAQAEEATPLEGSVFPKRTSEKNVILTIATEDDSILAEQNTIFAFFKALWLAGTDELKLELVKATVANPEEIIEKYKPVNFDEPPPSSLKREDAEVELALVLLPDSLEATGKTSSWSQAAHVAVAPEKFVLLGYIDDELVVEELGKYITSPLQVGFDPNNSEDNNFSPTESGDLNIPKELQWVVDFNQAVEKGMGFRVDLNAETRGGFDRLFVIGVRLSADETEGGGAKLLSELFDHHYYSSKGLSLIPQGTPTNNTDKERAGASGIDDPAATFDHYFKQKQFVEQTSDWQVKQDGQWLSEWLGLDPTLFNKVLYGQGRDQADGLNMNLALWPGTLGYAMDAMMKPVFSAETIDMTKQFMAMFVSGRGSVPAIRIGDQPYGILPTTAFHRQKWLYPVLTTVADTTSFLFNFGGLLNVKGSYLQALYEVLLKIEADWSRDLLPNIAHVSAEGVAKPHQKLLDIIGLHPNSVEFYHRYLQSLEMLYSYVSFALPFEQVQTGFDKMEFGKAYQLLLELGYDPKLSETSGELPLLSKLYGLDTNWEHKVVIDTVPLSESKTIRGYTATQENYITALRKLAAKSLDSLRKNEGLTEKPTALLFSFLKFALEQGYFDTAVRLHEAAKLFSPQQAAAVRTEQPFLHMKWEDKMVESRYALLYKNQDSIASGMMVADRISELIRDKIQIAGVSPGLLQQMDALRHLENISTARLERAFVEHLDCCSYRLDAWQQGLIKLQMMLMRENQPAGADSTAVVEAEKGIYLGAFGWLENVRPDKTKVLKVKSLSEELQEDFTASYVTDGANAGHIHAPSVNQAVTAAVLRNAFLTHGKVDENSEYAVNLSSERIRLALSVIEGIQNGQSLAALLGYKFERQLLDQTELRDKGVDTFIFALRKRFPLSADRILETQAEKQAEKDPSLDPDSIPISAVEARNVIHGKKLIAHVKKQTEVSNKSYPFGFSASKLPPADAVIANAINAAVDFIMNIEDAIADLGMAESVHQVCMGNYDRAAGVLESYSSGSYPQTPDVIRTPRSGPTLTHRVGMELEFMPTIAFDALNPRKSAEPTLNQWLERMLPPLTDILCYYEYVDRNTELAARGSVSLQALGLAPIDLLYLLNNTGQGALGELDEWLLHYIYEHEAPRLDQEIKLKYIKKQGDPLSPEELSKLSVFEVMSLVKSLRHLALQSSNLKPTDMQIAGEASSNTPLVATLARSRVDDMISALDGMLDTDPAGNFKTQVLDVFNALPDEPDALQAENIIQNVDQYLIAFIGQLHLLRRFGLPQTGSGDLFIRRQGLLASLQKKVGKVIDRLESRKLEFETLATVYDSTADDAVAQLQTMEALVSTQYSDLDTIDLVGVQAKKALFDTKLAAIKGVLVPGSITGLVVLVNSIRLVMTDLGDFDLETIDTTPEEAQLVRFVLNELKPRAQQLYGLVKQANAEALNTLAGLESLGPQARVKQLQSAAQKILGDEFRLIPRFELDEQTQFELSNAWGSTDLLEYLKNVHEPKFFAPEEDWLHGIARVREKMHHAENIILLRELFALNDGDLAIHPVQLPFKSEHYHWLAMPFPAEIELEENDTLLYTALTQETAAVPQYVCGFLVDEWTEVIPLETEATGLSFHYDRPNSEAAQTMLLVTPTSLTGNWQWQDLVDGLHNALDSARLRAVEPHQIDNTTYARYLPPLISPVTRHPITIAMYLTDLQLEPLNQ